MTPAERHAVLILLDVARDALKAILSFPLTPALGRKTAQYNLEKIDGASAWLKQEETNGKRNDSARV